MENLFRITFSGQISPGAHPDLVRTLIANRMKLTPAQVERMFCGKKVILKNNLPEEEAVAFSARLSRLGMLVDILPMPPADLADAAGTSAATETEGTGSASSPTPAVATPAEPAPGEIAAAAQAAASEAGEPAPEADATPQAEAAPPAAAEVSLTVSAALPTAQITQLTPRPDPASAAQASNPRFDESWLTQSSFANLARTHLNLDRAEALLNVASPALPRSIDLDVSPQTVAPAEPGPVLRMFDPESLAEPIAPPHQPIHISTEFSCTHCGTMHRIELNITQMEAPAQIRTRQDRASA